MKKIFLLVPMIAAIVSCGKNNAEVAEPAHLRIDISVNDGEGETKSVKSGWANNDRVFVLFPGHVDTGGATGKWLTLKYNSSTSKWEADSWSDGLESEIAKTTSGTLTALYSPVIKAFGSFSCSWKGGIRFSTHAGNMYNGYWMQATGVSYTVSGGTLSASINMTIGSACDQICINGFKHRNEKSFNANEPSEFDRYYLKVEKGSSTVFWDNDVPLVCDSSVGTISFTSSYINASGRERTCLEPIVSGGLCFYLKASLSSYRSMKFHLFDTVDNKEYVYTSNATFAPYSSRSVHAYTLPALNEKDSGGNYKWVEQ